MNEIEKAVSRLKSEYIQLAKRETVAIIRNAMSAFEDADRDLKGLSEKDKDIVKTVTRRVDIPPKPGMPRRRINSKKAEKILIKEAQNKASIQYDKFVSRLNSKIGEVKRASLRGNHVRGISLLTIETVSGNIEVWRTQMIANRSKLGKLSNELHIRKVKAK